MFIPAIKNPIATISPRLSPLKSLTLRINNKEPITIANQAKIRNISAALIPLFSTEFLFLNGYTLLVMVTTP